MKAAHAQSITDTIGALADLTRLRILRLLEPGELSVGEVAGVLQMPQSTVSRHLKLLAGAGWVSRRHEGTATFYSFVLDNLTESARALWLAGRDEVAREVDLAADQRRLQGVLAERRLDSRTFFGTHGGEWDAIRASLFGHVFTLSALLHLAPSEWTVADLGCGTGNAAEYLAPCVRRVIAVDQSEVMLEAARKRLEGFDNVTFVESELESLSLKNASVDAAVAVLVLHHLDEPGAALREMARILRPGGVALIVDMVRHERAEYQSRMGHVHLGFEPSRMRAQLTRAGLVDIRTHDLAADPDARGPGIFVARAAKPEEPSSHSHKDKR